MLTSGPSKHRRLVRLARFLAFAATALLPAGGVASAQQVTLALSTPGIAADAIDLGPLRSATPMQVSVGLAIAPDRSAALDAFLAGVSTPSSPQYHQWLTPQQFAAQFGAAGDEIATVSTWLASQGLTVGAVSAGGTRLAASGTAAQIQSAFAVSLHQYQVGTQSYFANTSSASLPASVAPSILSISGLSNMPTASIISGVSQAGVTVPLGTNADMFAIASAAVDTNSLPILTITTSACSSSFAQSDYGAYTALFRQASAQGITVFSTSGCGASGNGSFPASLAEVTAVAAPGAAPTTSFSGIDARPAWQSAPGLPTGTTRVEPDLATPSIAALAQTIAVVVQKAGSRQGNVNATLYTLASEPGLFAQPGSAAPGTWESATGLGQVDLAELAKVWPYGVNASTTSLTISSYSPVHGQSFTLSSTVTAQGGGATPTGTVVFSSTQGGQLASVALVNGAATYSTNQLPGGLYSFTATYSGDGTYAASTSSVGTVTVLPEPASLSAAASAGATFGGNITVTVTVASTSGVGTPTGTASVQPQGLGGGGTYTAMLTSTGVANAPATATVTLPVNQGGSFNILVSCSGDGSFSCYTPYTLPVTAATAASTVTLALVPSAPTVGSTFNLAVTVNRLSVITPTGTIEFYDSSTLIGTVGLSGGTATFTTKLSTGQHSYTAVYSGDTNYAPGTSPAVAIQAGTVSTTTSINSSVYGVTYSQPFTLTSTVQPSSSVNNTVPTGTIVFSAATQGILGTVALTNGTASLASLGNLPVGTYALTATYSGDSNFAPSASTPAAILTISPAQANIAAAISPSTVVAGATAALSVTVTLPYSGASPTGNVTATVNGVPGAVYTGALTASANGGAATATIQIPAPPAGTYTVQVTCTGTANFACYNPATVSLTSTSTGNTSTTLAVSPTTPSAGQPVTLTATIATTIAGTPTGTVTFFDGGTAIASAPVANKTATAVVTLAGGSNQSLTAVYSGDKIFNTSTSPAVIVNVITVPSTIVLTSSLTSALQGANIVFTAVVTAGISPTGSVTFFDTYNGATTALGSAKLSVSGAGASSAQLSTSGLFDGAHSVYAVYLGDANSGAATSPTLSIAINDYSVAMNPQTLTLTRGQSGTATLTVAAVGAFTGKVSFTCVAPANTETTCAVAPASISGPGTVTLSLTTTAASAQTRAPFAWRTASSAALALLLWFAVPGSRRRRPLPGLLLVLFALGITANLGCGSGVAAPFTGNVGTPVGSTQFAIDTAGTDGVTTVTHDYQYTVTLQ